MKTIILQTLTSVNKNMPKSLDRKRFDVRRSSILIPLVLLCFTLPAEGVDAPNKSGAAGAAKQLPSATTPEQAESATPNTPDPGPLPISNTADGQFALASIDTGIYNSAFGFYSLLSLTEGSFNTGVGAGTLMVSTASNNTAVGTGALFANTTGTNNTAHGTFALFNNIDGLEHTAVGASALLNNTGANDNTAVGLFAMLNNVNGSSNTAVGAAALRDNVSGVDNQALGRGALRFTTGSGNIGIGREAAANMTSSTNVVCIASPGDATVPDASNRTYIGNIRGVVVGNLDGINVIIDSDGQLGTSNSSARFKKDIKPMDHEISKAILALKPVTFHYKNADTKKAGDTPQFGLIAEDVAEVNPNLVVRDNNGDPLSVRYDAVNVMLLNEFLKEHKKVEKQATSISQLNCKMAEQETIIAQQQKGIQALTAQVQEQAAQIQKVSAQLELGKSAPQTVLNDK